jgi:hypothetical protein
LEERAGKRIVVDTNEELVFVEYRLAGDRLEVSGASGDRADSWYEYDLAGTWQRIA